MNTIIETQATGLANINCNSNSLSCHLYLDAFKVPLNIQDDIISETRKLKVANAGNIAKVLDKCYAI
ncbi:MAG: hypothetical protein HRU22_18590 [Gammaproteobacteria bacterium]|nr:hypothetical protein [Gammaproteobacteria bacterium]